MKIAVEGCAHGQLEKIYDTIHEIEDKYHLKIDLLLCCGDFQSTRNMNDLETMAVADKYRQMCSFYKYYSGELRAPILTIFIGGNHEASNYLQELPYGGWVAPNIYYLGYAGVVRVNGIRIVGLSGIYKAHDYLKGRFEFPPYSESTKRSVYHLRQLEVFRLKQLSGVIDICMSHDWPQGIYNYGNRSQLERYKPFLRKDMANHQLGSPPGQELLLNLQPHYWFSAHMHCKFAALVPVAQTETQQQYVNTNVSFNKQRQFIHFLALDRCLPNKRFLQVLDIKADGHINSESCLRFEYDLEWLTILSLTNSLININDSHYYLPNGNSGDKTVRYNFTPTTEEMQLVREIFKNDLNIPSNFCRTVEVYNPTKDNFNKCFQQPFAQINPQNRQFCNLLGVDDPLMVAMVSNGHQLIYSTILGNNDDSNLHLKDAEISLTQDEATNINIQLSLTDKSESKTLRTCLNLPKPKIIITTNDSTINTQKVYSDNQIETKITTICQEDSKLNALNTKNDDFVSKNPLLRMRRRNQELYKCEKA